jgi:hypothetical protein
MDDIIDNIEKGLLEAIEDVDHRNRAAVLDVLSLLLPPESFKQIISESINLLRYNYNNGNEEQKQHVEYVVNFILGNNEDSRTNTNYHPPA